MSERDARVRLIVGDGEERREYAYVEDVGWCHRQGDRVVTSLAEVPIAALPCWSFRWSASKLWLVPSSAVDEASYRRFVFSRFEQRFSKDTSIG